MFWARFLFINFNHQAMLRGVKLRLLEIEHFSLPLGLPLSEAEIFPSPAALVTKMLPHLDLVARSRVNGGLYSSY